MGDMGARELTWHIVVVTTGVIKPVNHTPIYQEVAAHLSPRMWCFSRSLESDGGEPINTEPTFQQVGSYVVVLPGRHILEHASHEFDPCWADLRRDELARTTQPGQPSLPRIPSNATTILEFLNLGKRKT